jgi:hypothetical protein
MSECTALLDRLTKKGSEWKLANAAANAPGATAKSRAALNRVEREFAALRDTAQRTVRETGTLAEKNRFAVLKTPRGTRAGRG